MKTLVALQMYYIALNASMFHRCIALMNMHFFLKRYVPTEVQCNTEFYLKIALIESIKPPIRGVIGYIAVPIQPF